MFRSGFRIGSGGADKDAASKAASRRTWVTANVGDGLPAGRKAAFPGICARLRFSAMDHDEETGDMANARSSNVTTLACSTMVSVR